MEFLSNLAVKEKQKSEEEFKRIEGVNSQKDQYKTKIKFEVFTENFAKYFKVFPEILNVNADSQDQLQRSEYSIANIVAINVLSASKAGRVVLVQSRATKNKFALKYWYRWKLAKFCEDEKFLKLMDILARYSQMDNVVKYLCIVDSNSLVFLYMPFYGGGSLLFHMRRLKTLNEDICKKIVSQLAYAVDAIHRDKRLVLDLRPEQILMDERGVPHIAIATSVKFRTADPPDKRVFKGSLAYFSPELVRGEAIGPAHDYWSLGILLYEMLYGPTPFDCEDVAKSRYFIENLELKFPDRQEVSESTKNILSRLLMK